MTDEQAQRRLRLNYVVAELDVVLRELVADVPFVTEETLRSKYRQLCGKELKSGLDAVGMTLYDIVEMKFADAFVAVRDAEMPGLLRRKFVNQPVVLAADASRTDAGVRDVRVKAEPAAVSVDSHDSDLAEAAVAAADESDEGRHEPKRARMDEPQKRGENADDAVSGSGPAVIRVGRKARVLSYDDAAKLLDAAKIRSKNLEQSRQALLRNHKRKTDRVALSVFDFHALVMNEPTLTHAKYARQKSSRNTWKEITCLRLSYGLKGLRVKCVHRPDRVYTVVETTRVSPAKHYVEDAQTGKISVKNLFEAKYGVRLEYPRLPVVVVVHSPNGRREFVPMECVQVVENKKLLFVSVLAARQVFKFTVDAAPTKRKRHRRRPRGAPVAAVSEAH